MPRRHLSSLALALFAAACSARDVVAPAPLSATAPSAFDVSAAAVPSVYISEIHYDNVGADADERIEINGPAGMNVTGWQVVLYNGSGGATYGTTQTLSGMVPAVCDTRGVIVLSYPADGIQNGSPDGIALVDAGGQVVEFLSYEGTFAATNGPAVGMTAVDIGVAQTGAPVGQSLQRNGADVWSGPATSSFGACNEGGQPPAAVASVVVTPASASVTQGATRAFTAAAFDASNQPVAGVAFTWTSSATTVATVSTTGVATGVQPGDATITATAPNGTAGSATLHVDPAPNTNLPPTRFSELHYDNFGTDAGEAIEIEGPAGTDVTGWQVVLYNGNGGVTYNMSTLSGTIPETASCTGRGVMVLTYPQDGIQNGSPDGMALVNASGEVMEFLSYEGTFTATNGPATGTLSVDIVASQTSSAVGQSLQRSASGTWTLATSSFGACNGTGGGTPVGNTVTFSGRTPNDPALPVGFQDQIFGTVRDATGTVVVTNLTWSSETPAVASIDQNGVITALTAGTATFRATAADGVTTATYALPTRVAVASTTAQYAGNAEFGEPADGSPSDDFIVRYPQYTASYNPTRGTPNWVSYNLEATHFGPEDRCDCFTFDPALPAAFPRYTTADYTGAGAFAGFGIDRGHLARSFDRTSASLDNALTFYFTNIIPQTADLNQGPWATMENDLGNLARVQDKEVYIVAGVAGDKGTVKGEGKIVIPAFTWKVAVIMARNQGLANVDDPGDLEVIAAIMPNEPGVRNVDWETYRVTVDAVEALSGYDLLALLRDDIEIAIESATKPPVAVVNGPFTALPGESVALSAAGSSDPDGDAIQFSWSFGDGGTGSGIAVSHTYARSGVYTVQLIVRDVRELADTVTTTVTVLAPSATIDEAMRLVGALVAAGKVDGGNANALRAKLDGAKKQLDAGHTNGASGKLGAFLNQLEAMIRSGRVTEGDVATLYDLVKRMMASIAT